MLKQFRPLSQSPAMRRLIPRQLASRSELYLIGSVGSGALYLSVAFSAITSR